MTVMQRVAICFAAGVVGAPAAVVLSHIMFALGLSQKLGVMAPVSLLVSLPFGIVTALVAKAIIGEKP